MKLIEYGLFYESIYKMSPTERPPDDIIKDDEKLDRWFEQYQRDAARALARQNMTKVNRQNQQEQTKVVDLSQSVFGRKKPKG